VPTVQRTPDDGRVARRRPLRRRSKRRQGDTGNVMSRDERLIWVGIALVAGVDGGILAGLLTAVAGGTKQVALGAGGVAALGTFGTVLTVVRFLHNSPEQ
jgi:hypothetical protein